MIAVLALADADAEDEAAYRARWDEHAAASREYLAALGQAPPDPEWVPRSVQRVVRAVAMMQRPTRYSALEAVWGEPSATYRFLRALRTAGLLVRSDGDPHDRRGRRYWLARNANRRVR